MMASINPATGETNREFELYSEERIYEAIRKSRTAFSEWKNLDISDRAEYLTNAANMLRRRKKELGEIITIEMGKPIKESIPRLKNVPGLLNTLQRMQRDFWNLRSWKQMQRKRMSHLNRGELYSASCPGTFRSGRLCVSLPRPYPAEMLYCSNIQATSRYAHWNLKRFF